jgi:hypothetical protein
MGGVLGNLGEGERPELTHVDLRHLEAAFDCGNHVVGFGGHFFEVDQSSLVTVTLSSKELLGQKELSFLMRASPLSFRPLPSASFSAAVTPCRDLPPVQGQCDIAARHGTYCIFIQVARVAPAGRRAKFG